MKKSLAPPAFAHFQSEWHLSPVLDTGDFVFFSGVTAVRPDGTLSRDPEEQFRDCFAFLESNLAVAGLGFDDVVELTSYHVELRQHLAAFIQVKDDYIAAPYPAWTAIGVSELITEGTLIELRIVARRTVAGEGHTP